MIKPAPTYIRDWLTTPQGKQWFQELFDQFGPALAFWQKARAYRAAAQSVAAGAWEKVLIDTVSFDPYGICDLTNHRITPTKAGYYQVNIGAHAPAPQFLAIYKNGTPIAGGQVTEGTTPDLVYLNGTTDYVEVWVYSSTGGGLGLGSYTNYISVLGPF